MGPRNTRLGVVGALHAVDDGLHILGGISQCVGHCRNFEGCQQVIFEKNSWKMTNKQFLSVRTRSKCGSGVDPHKFSNCFLHTTVG